MNVEVVDQVWWYTSRASGIVAWALLSLSVIAGLSISSRSTTLPAGWTLDLHRLISTLSLVFLAIHMVSLVPDDFVHFAAAELLVPFASEWRPAAVALGIVAFWLLVAVEISSLLRHRIPNRMWRIIHRGSVVVWTLATLHLVLAGTDAGHGAFRLVQLATATVIVALLVRRLRSRGRLHPVPV